MWLPTSLKGAAHQSRSYDHCNLNLYIILTCCIYVWLSFWYICGEPPDYSSQSQLHSKESDSIMEEGDYYRIRTVQGQFFSHFFASAFLFFVYMFGGNRKPFIKYNSRFLSRSLSTKTWATWESPWNWDKIFHQCHFINRGDKSVFIVPIGTMTGTFP